MNLPDLSRPCWRKSSYSSGNGACVEVALLRDTIAVRDSKDPDGPSLAFPAAAWTAFAAEIMAGQHNLS